MYMYYMLSVHFITLPGPPLFIPPKPRVYPGPKIHPTASPSNRRCGFPTASRIPSYQQYTFNTPEATMSEGMSKYEKVGTRRAALHPKMCKYMITLMQRGTPRPYIL